MREHLRSTHCLSLLSLSPCTASLPLSISHPHFGMHPLTKIEQINFDFRQEVRML